MKMVEVNSAYMLCCFFSVHFLKLLHNKPLLINRDYKGKLMNFRV